jgi:hypothetical protein
LGVVEEQQETLAMVCLEVLAVAALVALAQLAELERQGKVLLVAVVSLEG